MAISPSGIDYFETKPEDIVIMKLDGTIVEGSRKPSSEHNLHIALYKVTPTKFEEKINNILSFKKKLFFLYVGSSKLPSYNNFDERSNLNNSMLISY